MNFHSKAYAVVLIMFFITPVVGLLAYNIYIDPFQIIHKDSEQPDVLLSGRGTDRYQHAGVINQYDMNAIIVGHSHVANYLPSKVSSELGVENVYTLTMDGAPIYEQTQPARYALEQHDINWVLWGFTARNLLRNPKENNKKLPLNASLYDDYRINDLGFFLTFSLAGYNKKKQAKKEIIISSENRAELEKLEFDLATAWFPRNQCNFNRPTFVAQKIYGKKGITYNAKVLKSLTVLSKKQLSKSLSGRFLKKYKGNLNDNLLPLVTQFPETQFNFIISVFPTAVEQKMKVFSKNNYLQNLLVLKTFVKDMGKYSNVKIFSFGLEKFSDDLRLYKDYDHFHQSVNDYFLEQMGIGKGELTINNIDAYVMAFDEKISTYRLPEKWNPKMQKVRKIKGYLSYEMARLLIKAEDPVVDNYVTRQSMMQEKLPKCAQKLIKNTNG